MDRFCAQCGQRVDGVAFCTSCGTPVGSAVVLPPPPPPPALPSPSPPRRPLLVLGGVAVALALVLGGLVAFTLVRSHHGPGATLAVRSRSIDNGLTVLGDPQQQWTLSARSLLPKASFGPIDGWNDSEDPSPDLLAVGPYLLATLANRHDGLLIAIDGLTGKKVWAHDLGHNKYAGNTTTCWPVATTRVLCTAATGFQLLDLADGSVVAGASDRLTFDLPPLHDATSIYAVIDVPHSRRHQLAAYDLTTLSRRATTDVPALTGWDYYSVGGSITLGDSSVTITRGRFSGYGQQAVAYALPDLSLASDTPSRKGWADLDDGWTVSDDNAEFETTTVTRDGAIVLQADGSPWSTVADLNGRTGPGWILNGRIGVGTAAYDLGSGRKLWSRSDLAGEWPSWTDDGLQVIVSDDSTYDESTTAIDAADGSTQWTIDTGFFPTFTTRDALVSVEADEDGGNERLTVRRRDTGDLVWSRSLRGLGRNGYLSSPTAADQGIAVVNEHTVRGWSGFPQSAPGAGTSGDGSSPAPSDGGTAYATDCGNPPTFTPVRSASEYGGISITYRVTAVCPGGQWLSGSQLSVPLEVDGEDYLSGWFDFSGQPYWIPDGGVDLTLTYPFENATAPQQQIQDAIDDAAGGGSTVIHVPCTPGPSNDAGTVPADPSYGQDPTIPTTADGDPDATTPQQSEDNALAALRRIAARDKPAVEALDWTAQLSAKKLGTQDDGIVYASYSDILALHLRLRSRYPDALLVFSTEWPGSYGPSSAGFWVTLSGDSMSAAPPVNRWCRNQHRGPGDCWAKRLATSGDPDDNTVHRKPGH